MSITEHQSLGHVLVGNWGLEVGDDYHHNWGNYKIIEVCDGDLKGHCWIERIKK